MGHRVKLMTHRRNILVILVEGHIVDLFFIKLICLPNDWIFENSIAKSRGATFLAPYDDISKLLDFF